MYDEDNFPNSNLIMMHRILEEFVDKIRSHDAAVSLEICNYAIKGPVNSVLVDLYNLAALLDCAALPLQVHIIDSGFTLREFVTTSDGDQLHLFTCDYNEAYNS
jgi:hypothetical protein